MAYTVKVRHWIADVYTTLDCVVAMNIALWCILQIFVGNSILLSISYLFFFKNKFQVKLIYHCSRQAANYITIFVLEIKLKLTDQ